MFVYAGPMREANFISGGSFALIVLVAVWLMYGNYSRPDDMQRTAGLDVPGMLGMSPLFTVSYTCEPSQKSERRNAGFTGSSVSAVATVWGPNDRFFASDNEDAISFAQSARQGCAVASIHRQDARYIERAFRTILRQGERAAAHDQHKRLIYSGE